jgi:hypothetical protein
MGERESCIHLVGALGRQEPGRDAERHDDDEADDDCVSKTEGVST